MTRSETTTRAWRNAIYISFFILPGSLICPTIVMAQPASVFTAIGNMTTARSGHTATLLNNGMVLIAGGSDASAELYNPLTRTFGATGNMTTARLGQTATLLNNGRVLIAGGAIDGITSRSAELYDLSTRAFTRTGNMSIARWGHSATLLNDGKVLLAGGVENSSLATAEIYDPATGTFTTATNDIRANFGHTATLLHDGRVLIAGGNSGEGSGLDIAEVYEPSTRTFSRTGRMGAPRQEHTATLLNDGKVLIAGGEDDTTGWNFHSAELYDPLTGLFSPTGSMSGSNPQDSLGGGRASHTATLLPDGRVLVAGSTKLACGAQFGSCHLLSNASAETYDPVKRIFSLVFNMTVPRAFHTATLLSDGTVLIAGGASGLAPWEGGPPTATAEIYGPFTYLSGPAQPGIITTYAGASPPKDGAQAITQGLNGPSSVAPDGTGGFYVVSDNRIYRVFIDGRIQAVAGNGGAGFNGDGGFATAAGLNFPGGIATDTSGNLYIADTNNSRVRKVTPDGVIHTIAGNGKEGSSGDGGLATSAQIASPSGVAVDAAGNLYIADSGNNRIRKVTQNGLISTVAGNGIRGFSGDGGPANSAQLSFPWGVATDATGNLYIIDSNVRIRKVNPSGVIITVAGTGVNGFSGDGGAAISARISFSSRIAVDAAGNIYITGTDNNRVRKVSLDGTINTIVGNGTAGFSGDGGLATSARLNFPNGVAVDAAGSLYIADGNNNRVRKVTPDGVIHTVAGNGTAGFSGDDGPATAALLDSPLGVTIDAAGNLYIADTANNRVRKVTSEGVISTVAGNGLSGFAGDGGAATTAQLNGPYSVAVDGTGNLYIADTSNRIRKVTPDGVIRTIAGNGISGFSGDGGPATSASFRSGSGIAVDAVGNLYIADAGNGRVRKVTPGGVISTVYVGSVAMSGIAVDGAGNLYIETLPFHWDSYSFTSVIEKMTPDGRISTVFSREISCDPTSGITVDAIGNIYVFNGYVDSVIKITPEGVYRGVAGGYFGTGGDGGLSTLAQFTSMSGIAVDAAGNLYMTDGDRIRKIAFGFVVSSITPNAGGRGNVINVSLNGSNFDSSLVINPIDGITVSNLTVTGPDFATATFTVAAAAVFGPHNATATTSTGTSNVFTFTVNPPPSVTSLVPPFGVPGTVVVMALTGTGFGSGMAVDAGSGIAVSNISIADATSATATFEIVPGAALGTRGVTVETLDGMSTPLVFNVVPPFADLTVASTHSANFGVGFTETYSIRVSNVGLVASTDAMSITDVLPSGLQFVSGSGSGWSCTSVGQTVTCSSSGPQGAGASTNLELAVEVSSDAVGDISHTVTVATAGDVNPLNDSASDRIRVVATPTPQFVITPIFPGAGQQATMGIRLLTPFPHDLNGSVTLGFSSNVSVPTDEPAVQFATGGRQTTYTIPANTLEARIDGNGSAGPIGFQTGTIAGTLGFTGTLQAGSVQSSLFGGTRSLTIQRQPPFIQNLATSTQNGFAVVIGLWSTTREVTQLNLTFNTTTKVSLNCGSVTNCSVSNSTMTFDVRSLFGAWFGSDSTFGSLSTLHLPFSISGTVHGTVAVSLSNTMGTSKAASFPLP